MKTERPLTPWRIRFGFIMRRVRNQIFLGHFLKEYPDKNADKAKIFLDLYFRTRDSDYLVQAAIACLMEYMRGENERMSVD